MEKLSVQTNGTTEPQAVHTNAIFASTDDEQPTQIHDWLTTEINLWHELHNDIRSNTTDQSALNDIAYVVDKFEKFYSTLASISDAGQARNTLRHNLQVDLISLQSRFGRTLLKHARSAPIQVLDILAGVANSPWPLPTLTARGDAWLASLQLQTAYTLDYAEQEFSSETHKIKNARVQIAQLENERSKIVKSFKDAIDFHIGELKRAESDQAIARTASLAEFQQTLDSKTAQIQALHEAYHTELGLEAPAQFWSNEANDARKASRWFYALFLGLVVIGIAGSVWAASLLWETIGVMASSSAGAPFGLMAMILVPVLGYAWLLKQVSRLFLTNRAIADDASYRHVMTMTYLGLVKDPNSGITKEERGLILNALFRPAPASTQDDGPPMGVFDLINGKKP